MLCLKIAVLFKLPVFVLTFLVCYRAGNLAGRLAGSLALAASAFNSTFF